jgi:competence ComEA-like helix-hairpin-helix protein
MAGWKEFFAFNKQEQRGVFFLLLAIFMLQGLYFLLRGDYLGSGEASFKPDWEQLGYLDSIDRAASQSKDRELRLFNPNYITEFRGYSMGMTAEELDRLYAYRNANNFVNSAWEFKEVTGISDSLLTILAPRFRFPRGNLYNSPEEKSVAAGGVKMVIPKWDLNKATAGDLRQINGIGAVLSERIIRFREALGGFLQDSQLYDVYGLDAEVVARTLGRFRVVEPPDITPIDINTASVEEIAGLVYISFPMAEAIVEYREKVGGIGSFDEISRLEGFPSDKIERIKLYLRL